MKPLHLHCLLKDSREKLLIPFWEFITLGSQETENSGSLYNLVSRALCSQSIMGTPHFPGDAFQWAQFCNVSFLILTFIIYTIFYKLIKTIHHFNKVSFLYFKSEQKFYIWKHQKEDVPEVVENRIKTTYVNNARLASIKLTKKVHTKTAHRQAPDIVKQYLKFCTVNY